jgi:phospholipid transport system substrate-binding protein
VFGEYVLKTYSVRLGRYAGATMTILSERPAGAKDVVVSTRIVRPSGAPIATEWRVRTTGGRYRVIDIMVEGVSMVVTQRSEFAAVIRRYRLQGLIEVLRAYYAPVDADPEGNTPRFIQQVNHIRSPEVATR